MKGEGCSARSQLHREKFDDAKKTIAANVDALISQIDAGSSDVALAEANKGIDSAAQDVKTLAEKRVAALLVEAAGNALRSGGRLAEIAAEDGGLRAELAALPLTGDLQLILSICYLIAALAAFFTELILTNSLTFLLGFSADDPTGRAMGAAFAASLLVFEVIFVKLGLIHDPWPLFRPSEPDRGSAPITKLNSWQPLLRASAGIMLLVTLVGIALLQGATIVKMAPTREIAGKLRSDKKARLSPTEEQEVKESVLFFSVCVLISGGFLAAAGTQEIGLWSQRRNLERKIKNLTDEGNTRAENLNKDEKPALAAELAACGLPFMWVLSVSIADLARELTNVQGTHGDGASGTIATAASHESDIFAADKRIALDKARAKLPPPHARKSMVEITTDIIENALAGGRSSNAG